MWKLLTALHIDNVSVAPPLFFCLSLPEPSKQLYLDRCDHNMDKDGLKGGGTLTI